MPDVEIKTQTDPTTKGTSTSEFKFAAAVAAIAGLVGGLESAMMILKDAYPTAWWVPLASGLLAMVGAAFAYLRSRSAVKVAMIDAGTQVALSQDRVAVVKATTLNP